jgi:hypothetical protein
VDLKVRKVDDILLSLHKNEKLRANIDVLDASLELEKNESG